VRKIDPRRFVSAKVVLSQVKTAFKPGDLFMTEDVVNLFTESQREAGFASYQRIQARLTTMTSPSNDAYIDPPVFERVDGIGSSRWRMVKPEKSRVEIISEIHTLLEKLK
jgi:hypothetical protein